MSKAHNAGTFPATAPLQASIGQHGVNSAPATDKSATDCHFFLLGTCRNGDACEFRHVVAARTSPPCGFWAQGQCFKGRECQFRHPSLSAGGGGYAAFAARGANYDSGFGGGYLPGGYPPGAGYLPGGDRSRTPCTFFMRGHCAKGPICPFLHPVSAGAGLHMDAESAYPPEHVESHLPQPAMVRKAQPQEAARPYTHSQAPAQPSSPNPVFAAAKAFGCSSAKAPPVPLETGGARDSPFSNSPFNRLEPKGAGTLFGSAVGSMLKEKSGEVVFKRIACDAGTGPQEGGRPAAQKKRAAHQDDNGERKAPLREAKKARPNQQDPGMQLQSMFGRMAADPESRQRQHLKPQQQQQQHQEHQVDKRLPKVSSANGKGNGSRVVLIGTSGKPKASVTESSLRDSGARRQKDVIGAPKNTVKGQDLDGRVKPKKGFSQKVVDTKVVDTPVVRKPQFGKAAAERARQVMAAKTQVASNPPPVERVGVNEAATQSKHNQHKLVPKGTTTTQAKAVSHPETFSGPRSFEDIMKEKRMRRELLGSSAVALANKSYPKTYSSTDAAEISFRPERAPNTETHAPEVEILEINSGADFREESAGVDDAELDAELEEALKIEF